MPRSPIHPGEILAEQLSAANLSAAALARSLEVTSSRIAGILRGERAITADLALRLAHFFGTSAEFWMNLQQLYELRAARQRAGATISRLPRLPPVVRSGGQRAA